MKDKRLSVASTDIESLYNYYKTKVNDLKKDGKVTFDNIKGNREGISYTLYEYLQDYYNKNKFIDELDCSGYKDLSAVTLYHGFQSYDHVKDFFNDFNRHYCYGVYGSGMYTTTSQEDAIGYTKSKFGLNPERVVEFKFPSKNIIEHEDVWKLSTIIADKKAPYKNILNKLDDKQMKKFHEVQSFLDKINDYDFTSAVCANPGNVALLLGFDAYWRKKPYRYETYHFIIVRPDMLVISEKEKSRVIDYLNYVASENE